MARTVTRSDIRSKIRLKADRPSTVRPTNANLDDLIDGAWTHLWDLLVEAEPERYVKQADITVTASTRSYNLPSDFKVCMGVAVQDNDMPDGYSILERYNWDERYDYTYAQQKEWTRYHIQYGRIWFHPTPSWSGTVRIEYVPYAEEWDDSTNIDTVNGWDEWIVYQVCADLLGLDKEDPSYFLAKKQEVENRILKSVALDVGKPKTVVDYRRSSKKYPGWGW